MCQVQFVTLYSTEKYFVLVLKRKTLISKDSTTCSSKCVFYEEKRSSTPAFKGWNRRYVRCLQRYVVNAEYWFKTCWTEGLSFLRLKRVLAISPWSWKTDSFQNQSVLKLGMRLLPLDHSCCGCKGAVARVKAAQASAKITFSPQVNSEGVFQNCFEWIWHQNSSSLFSLPAFGTLDLLNSSAQLWELPCPGKGAVAGCTETEGSGCLTQLCRLPRRPRGEGGAARGAVSSLPRRRGAGGRHLERRPDGGRGLGLAAGAAGGERRLVAGGGARWGGGRGGAAAGPVGRRAAGRGLSGRGAVWGG